MIFPKVDTLVVPKNIDQYLAEKEVWYCDGEYAPINLLIEKSFYNGNPTLNYQLSFDPSDIIDEWEEQGFEFFEQESENEIDYDGYEFESYIRQYIGKRDTVLLANLKGDSESATCVLWVDNEIDFRKLLKYCFEALAEPSI